MVSDMCNCLLAEAFILMCMQNRCQRAKEIRMSQKNMHTAGPKSFARIRDEMVLYVILFLVICVF